MNVDVQRIDGPGGGDPVLGHVARQELDASHGVVLYLDDISVSFDGFKALNQLSLVIDVGELRCVIGPNVTLGARTRLHSHVVVDGHTTVGEPPMVGIV